MVKNSQCNRLYDLAKDVPNNLHIVEIGSWRGKSTCCLGLGSLHGNQALVTAIDLWRYHKVKRYNANEHLKAFINNIKELGLQEIVTYIEGDSRKISKTWDEKNEIGLLFIDGDHSYKNVSKDFKSWYPFVVNNGYIVFHDYQKLFPGVFDFVNECLLDNKINYCFQEKCLLVTRKREL